MDFNQARNSFYHVRTLFISQLFPFISHPQYPTSHISPFSMETSSRRESRVMCVVAGMRADRLYTRASTPFTCVSSVFEVDPPPLFLLRYYSTSCWLEFLKKN
jgi:hypothetical protein